MSWLLSDYSHLELEDHDPFAREAAIQSGIAHYADGLPVEAKPKAVHTALFDSALRRNAGELATVVAAAAQHLASLSRGTLVLISLARAGVPAGVWLRYRLQDFHGLEVHHYAVSIVRDRGLDSHALAWVANNHDPRDLVFVDGWTGKGTIRRELSMALQQPDLRAMGVPDRLAVLSDPAGVADVLGTHADFLVPTACLNSTSCGLISRTVLPQRGASSPYHGAKQYRGFASWDRSRMSIDVLVSAMTRIDSEVPVPLRSPRQGAQAAQTIGDAAQQWGISDLNLVKPGIGETTRVLQRRIPWRILLHPDWSDHPDLEHVRVLAAERGVPVVEVDTSPYRCIGLIRPLSRR